MIRKDLMVNMENDKYYGCQPDSGFSMAKARGILNHHGTPINCNDYICIGRCDREVVSNYCCPITMLNHWSVCKILANCSFSGRVLVCIPVF